MKNVLNGASPEPREQGASSDHHVDVLVVGSGPAGATAALALATYGLKVHVVTRWNWLANSPRAHITNQRAMEVLRDLGIEDEAHRVGTPWRQMGEMVFATSLAGAEIARLHTWGVGPDRRTDYLQGSPCPLLDIPQPLMESILVESAASRGAHLSFNTEYLSHEQDSTGVTSTLQDRVTGNIYSIRSRYLVGADGANSRIAEEIGLPIEGRMGRAGTVYARFTADLSSFVAHRPGILHRILIPAHGEIGMRTLRAVRPWSDWIAGWGFDVNGPEPDLSADTALAVIRQMIGDSSIEVDVRNVTSWKVNQAYATHYSKGRVFCAGDAVHRHPPSSGLGSNTSMQDAFNLAWRLAYVIRGWAREEILDEYSEERVPVGRQVVERANRSRMDYHAINRLLRPDEELAGRRPIDLVDEPSAAGVAVRDELAEAVKVKNFEFNAQGIELDQRYSSSGIISDGSPVDEPHRDPTLYAHPTTRPGAKIPHAWLVDGRGHKHSTLDIVGRGRHTIVSGVAGTAWDAAVQHLDLPYLRAVLIGGPALRDAYGTWREVRGTHEAGALLVRPDGHVAWRHPHPVWDEAEARELLESVLGTLSLSGASSVLEHLAV